MTTTISNKAMLGSVIAAISTPPGKGGVAIIRMSGEGALAIAERVFYPLSGKRLGDYPPRTQVYGYIIEGTEKIDDGLATLFPRGASYTGEQTVEISIHGGRLVTETVLGLLFTNGAVAAEAGEFTRRAFLNGRLTLTEAEAIGTLLDAKSREQLKLSSDSSRKLLRGEIDALRRMLVEILSTMLASIDYPEEDLGELSDSEIEERLVILRERIDRLIKSYRTGRAINEGIPTVLIGRPNAGKSTLYNLLLGEDAAIVTDIEGTTRDLLERTLSLGRVLLRLTDTAGIRATEASDPIERIGIERSLERAKAAELIITVLDGSVGDTGEDGINSLLGGSPAKKICIVNKSDLIDRPALPKDGVYDRVIVGSAERDGDRLRLELAEAIDALMTDTDLCSEECAIVANARQHAALLRASELISSALDAHRIGVPRDAVASDIEGALGAIGELDGRAVSEEVVSDIFSRFCVGK